MLGQVPKSVLPALKPGPQDVEVSGRHGEIGYLVVGCAYLRNGCRSVFREMMQSGRREGRRKSEKCAKGTKLTTMQSEQARTALLAFIVSSSDDAIPAKTPDGIVTSWNRGAERIYGYTAGEIVGKPVPILIPPDRPDVMHEMRARIRGGEQVEHYETTRMRKDGELIAISLTVSPIHDSAGVLVGVSSIARDISQRRRTEEQLRAATQSIDDRTALLASIVDYSDDAIIAKSPQGVVTSWNRGAELIYGYSSSEIIGKPVSMLIHPDRPDEIDRKSVV